MVFFLLQQAFRDKHWKINILYACLLEPCVQLFLDILPNRVACRAENRAAPYARILNQLCFLDHIRVPLGKILFHWGNCFNQFFFVCHSLLFSAALARRLCWPQRLHLLHCCRYSSRGLFAIRNQEAFPLEAFPIRQKDPLYHYKGPNVRRYHPN